MAQPTLTAGQYTCVPGDVFTFRSSGAVSPGPSGPAQTWSYSSLVLNPPEDQLYVEPGTSSGAIHFPTATVLYEATGSGGGTFYSASDNEVLDLGYFASIGGDVVGLCTDPRTVITYPFTYGSTFTDGYVCSETGGSFSDRVRTGTTTVTADGYGTLEAMSAGDGIALAISERPDLILMDIQLPDMNGAAALRRLRADAATAAIPVLAVTASVMQNERNSIVAAGFDGFLGKPFALRELLALVRDTLEKRR